MPGRADLVAQRGELGTDRAAFGLPLGRHRRRSRPSLRTTSVHHAERHRHDGGGVEEELVAGRQHRHPRIGVRGPRRAGGAERLSNEHRFGGRPRNQPSHPRRAGRAAAGRRAVDRARAGAREAFRSRPDSPRPAARTTRPSRAAGPFHGPPVQPHSEPIRHILPQIDAAACTRRRTNVRDHSLWATAYRVRLWIRDRPLTRAHDAFGSDPSQPIATLNSSHRLRASAELTIPMSWPSQ